MPLLKLLPRELDALEADIAMALGNPSLPPIQRTELERRLEAIRLKIELNQPQ